MNKLQEASKKIARWKKDPVYFVTNELKADPDAWQIDFLRAFSDTQKRRIAMQACKGPGKTAALAWCIWNFLSCYCSKGSHPKGAATSITADNLKDNLWPELAKWQGRSTFLTNAFAWTKERVFEKEHPETWFFSARAWPRTAETSQQSNTLAGLHADYLLFVLDESGGIPDAVMATAEGGLSTGKWAKIVQAGNPTHNEGPLYRAATSERHMWHLITITGDPDDPNRSSRISVQWAREQIEKYGKDNPWVLVNVFGRFPPSSINALLGAHEVEEAMRRNPSEDKWNFAQRRIGVDVARFGDDRTILFPRQGLMAFPFVEMRNARSNDIAARIAQAKEKWGSEMEIIDDTGGYGSGVIDSLIQAGHGPISVNFSGKATDAKYFNKRSEMWFLMAEWVKRGGALPQSPELARELTVPTYSFMNGKFRLEEKDQIKERLGFSPDISDALALTFALPDMPTAIGQFMRKPKGSAVVSDYNPFDESRLVGVS